MVKTNLPVLIIKNLILFPSSEIRLEFEREEEKELLSLAENYYQNKILLVNPIDDITDNIDTNLLPSIGVVGLIKMKMEMPNGKTRIIIKGEYRAKVYAYSKDDDLFEAMTAEANISSIDPKEELAYRHRLLSKLEEYVNAMPYIGNAILSQVENISTLSKLTDIICLNLDNTYDKNIDYINEINPIKRAEMLLTDMQDNLNVLELEKEIDEKLNKSLEESQKEFVLREKLNIIKSELHEDNLSQDLIDLKESIDSRKLPINIKERLEKEFKKLIDNNPNIPDIAITRNYIDTLLSLPYNIYTKDNKDLNNIELKLNNSHYGLNDIKERILEYIAVKQNNKDVKSPIICLVGPPGTGKTSLAISIAKALNRNYAKISVGGISDEAELVGHRKTYVGAMPGKIIQGIKKAKSFNPVFIIDEIDKMTKDLRGDPASALLEVLDPKQNNHFQDHYIEEDIDLSEVFFILTANYIEQIPYELQDRLEIIELSSYTEFEKLDILKKYIIKNELKNHGLTSRDLKIDDDALRVIIKNYTEEAGLRDLTRMIESICRKVVKNRITKRKNTKVIITPDNIDNYLGPRKYIDDIKDNKYVGYINALAYTMYGGKVLGIEATMYDGDGKVEITGSIGNVMKESVEIALSYIKSHSKEFKIDKEMFNNKNIHIHFIEGAVKKDGPSAGTAIVSCLISLFKNKVIKSNISMSGEISLRGEILDVGGIKEKVIAAYTHNINKIYLPKNNEKDLNKIPDEIKNKIDFKFVENYIDIYKEIF